MTEGMRLVDNTATNKKEFVCGFMRENGLNHILFI
jgi:hypothetical protein